MDNTSEPTNVVQQLKTYVDTEPRQTLFSLTHSLDNWGEVATCKHCFGFNNKYGSSFAFIIGFFQLKFNRFFSVEWNFLEIFKSWIKKYIKSILFFENDMYCDYFIKTILLSNWNVQRFGIKLFWTIFGNKWKTNGFQSRLILSNYLSQFWIFFGDFSLDAELLTVEWLMHLYAIQNDEHLDRWVLLVDLRWREFLAQCHHLCRSFACKMEPLHRRHQNIRNDCNKDKKQIDFNGNIVTFINFLIILWEFFFD